MSATTLRHNAFFNPDVLSLDCAAETARIADFLVNSLRRLNRRGLCLGVSGGIDSAACAALAVRALGPKRVLGLLMPERDMTDDAHDRAERLCKQLGISYAVEDIGPTLEAVGCYERRDEAIRNIVPGYASNWRHKIVISPATENTFAHFNIVTADPDGLQTSTRMPVEA